MAQHSSSGDQEPDWALARTSPKDFFGLPDNFDAKALKRAYTRLIKLYKPEREPERFQQIRAAYELLKTGSPSQAEPGVVTDSAFQPEAALSNELQDGWEQDPEALYASLQALEQKSAWTYCQLAVLSDLFDNKKRMEDWLLEGLVTFPGNPTLVKTFAAWCSAPGDVGRLASFLPVMARTLTPGSFLQFSEVLWIFLSRQCPYAEWLKLFQQCLASLGHVPTLQLICFRIKLGRRLFWYVENLWIETLLKDCGALQDPLSLSENEEVQFLGLLNFYHQAREQECAEPHPLLVEIHKEVVFWCEHEDPERFGRFMANLRSRGVELLAAFPLYGRSSQLLLMLLESILIEIDRLAGRQVSIPAGETERALDLTLRLKRTGFFNQFFRYSLTNLPGYGLTPFCILVSLFSPLLFWDSISPLILIPAILLGNLGYFFYGRKRIQIWRDKLHLRNSQILYKKYWRKELLITIRCNGYDFDQLTGEMEQCPQQQNFPYQKFLISTIKADSALRLLSLSRFFCY